MDTRRNSKKWSEELSENEKSVNENNFVPILADQVELRHDRRVERKRVVQDDVLAFKKI